MMDKPFSTRFGGCLFACAVGILASGPCRAQWVETGKATGFASASAPFTHSILSKGPYLFAGANGGLFRSADEGAGWEKLTKGFEGNEAWAVMEGESLEGNGQGIGLARRYSFRRSR